MRFPSLLRVEIGRLFRRPLTWLLLLAAAIGPCAGLWLSGESATSLNSTYLAVPALAGALVGAAALALLAALELDRVHRSGVDVLLDALSSPLSAALARTLALLAAAAAAQLLTLAFWLPFTLASTGSAFQAKWYAAAYLLIMLPAMLLSILFTASAYQITRRLDLTLVLDAAFLLLSLNLWQDNWLLRWVNPPVSYMTDNFGNTRLFLSVAWNRLFWLLALGALWLLSFLCIRRYGKGIPGSLARNARRAYLPLLAALLAVGGLRAYWGQPFLDHSNPIIDDSYSFYVSDYVTYDSVHVDARPNLLTGSQWGTVTYAIRNASGRAQTASFQVNPGYRFQSVTANGSPVPFRDLGDDDRNAKTMEVDLPADQYIELVIEYGGFPQEWNILALNQGELEISRDYMMFTKYDFSPAPKDFIWGGDGPPVITANLTLPADMTPLLFGPGTAEQLSANPDGSVNWRLTEQSALLYVYAGDYISEKIHAAGLDIEFFYSANHRRVMEECRVDQVLGQVFEYCTDRYGPLSFYGESGMKLIELGASGGGYAGNGVSVMSEDSFSEEGLKDPRKGAGGSEVLAHEIIHQWWGLGNMFNMADPADAWSSEGLTVYTTYRLMKQLHGPEYVQEFYIDQWQAQVDDYYQNFYVRNPEFLSRLPEKYRTRIANSLSSVRRYCEMPLKLLKAEALVGGEERMDQILSGLFNREIDYSYPYLTYQEFLDACGLNEEDLNLG